MSKFKRLFNLHEGTTASRREIPVKVFFAFLELCQIQPVAEQPDEGEFLYAPGKMIKAFNF